MLKFSNLKEEAKAHTMGPAIKEVPESAIAAHPLAQNPESISSMRKMLLTKLVATRILRSKAVKEIIFSVTQKYFHTS
jgi:hypothetical protein